MSKLKNLIIKLVAITIVFSGCANLSYDVNASQKRRIQKFNSSVGTWVWDTNIIKDYNPKVVNFLKKNNVHEIYLQINEDIDFSYYKSFISDLAKINVDVYALDGAPTWALPNGRGDVQKFFSWVQQYNNSVGESEKFKGVHIDVEPYLNYEWSQNTETAVKEYQDYFLDALNKAKSINIEFAVDIPFWFDEIGCLDGTKKTNLAEWVIKNGETINIMAYRDKAEGDNGIVKLIENELKMAKLYGKKCVVGVETIKSSEAEYVSFYEEGCTKMFTELEKVRNIYAENGINTEFAIHDLVNWMNLKA